MITLLVNLIYYFTLLKVVMIRILKLKNFKGIKSGEIELAPLTILLGANNSGKTTILEALFLAPNPLRKVPYRVFHGSLYLDRAAQVVHEMHRTLESEGFAFLFNNYTSELAEIECKMDKEDYLLQFIKGDPYYIYISTNKEIREFRTTRLDGKDIKYFGTLSLSSSETTAAYEFLFIDDTLLITSKLVKAGFEYLRYNWAYIINSGICEKITKEASTLSPEKYENVTIEPFLGGKLAIYAFLEDGSRRRLGDLGEGIQSYIIARILYEFIKPKVLLWDDVEAHFNPRVLLKISEWFSDIVKEGKQVVLTTHSLEAVRTIASLNEEKAKIYLTSLKKGVLETKGLTLGEFEELLKAGVDLRVAEPLLL